MFAAIASAWDGRYGVGDAEEDSGRGMVVGEGSESASVPGPVVVVVVATVDVEACAGPCDVGVDSGEGAKSPVLWIMDPSFRDRMNVDWTPGRDVRCDRSALTC